MSAPFIASSVVAVMVAAGFAGPQESTESQESRPNSPSRELEPEGASPDVLGRVYSQLLARAAAALQREYSTMNSSSDPDASGGEEDAGKLDRKRLRLFSCSEHQFLVAAPLHGAALRAEVRGQDAEVRGQAAVRSVPKEDGRRPATSQERGASGARKGVQVLGALLLVDSRPDAVTAAAPMRAGVYEVAFRHASQSILLIDEQDRVTTIPLEPSETHDERLEKIKRIAQGERSKGSGETADATGEVRDERVDPTQESGKTRESGKAKGPEASGSTEASVEETWSRCILRIAQHFYGRS